MQIWFYMRECQIKDMVFADGSFSDIENKSKTVVGICFYINPEDKTQRLCIASENIGSFPWGLYTGNWAEGINLADTPGYDVFDVPTLINNMAGSDISDSTYRDETPSGDADGFKVQTSGTAIAELGWEMLKTNLEGYNEGTKLPWGLINTLKIIAHRDTILTDSKIQLPQPHEAGNQSKYANLLQLMQDVVNNNANQTKYSEFYYPAASLCNAYEPVVPAGDNIADCFKAGKWFLPSLGEMARVYWWNTHNELQELTVNGIFAPHVSSGRFAALGTPWFWCSSEYTQAGAWYINFFNGVIYGAFKNTSTAVRPVCAF